MTSKNQHKTTQATSIVVPGQNQRPCISSKMATSLVSRIYGLVPGKVKELDSYDDRNFYVKVSPEHTNPNIKDVCSHGYVLKVVNCLESKTNHVDVEFAAQHHLTEHGISCPRAVPSCDGQTYQLLHLPDYADTTFTGETSRDNNSLNQVRLMEFVPGAVFNTVPYTPHLLANAGAFLGNLHNALQEFSDPRLTEGDTLWCLNNISAVCPFLPAICDVTRRQLADNVINTFCDDVIIDTSKLPKGTIHGDFNDGNILVGPSSTTPGDHDVTGLIDFGDLSHSCYVFELGIAIMYMSIDSQEVAPLLAGGHFLSGYLQQRHLVEAEWRVLKKCVCARYAQSLVMGAYYTQSDPDNEYLSKTSTRGWEQLTEIWNTPQEQLYQMWCDVIRDCGTGVQLPL